MSNRKIFINTYIPKFSISNTAYCKVLFLDKDIDLVTLFDLS